MQLLPYPKARHPSGHILFQDRELLGAPEPTMRQVRGNRIAMIFQEPMTSLNPLHTIEKQVNEVLRLHKRLAPTAARARTLELLRAGRAAGGGAPARRLSAPAVGRPAPARDDRHGAGQRARPAHRRRAHHRAGRHHPGPDPHAAARAAGPVRHGAAAHHPRPGDRAPDGRARVRDEPGRDRRGRRHPPDLRGARPPVHAAPACRRAPPDGARPAGRRADRAGRRTTCACGFPSGAGCCDARWATSRRSTA